MSCSHFICWTLSRSNDQRCISLELLRTFTLGDCKLPTVGNSARQSEDKSSLAIAHGDMEEKGACT